MARSLCLRSRCVFLRLRCLGRGRRSHSRRLCLLVGRGWSLSPPGRSPCLPLLGPRLSSRRVRRGAWLRRVRLFSVSGRPQSLAFPFGLLPRLRLRFVELPRARRRPRAPRRRVPRTAIRLPSQPGPSRLLAGIVGSARRCVGWRLSLRPRPAPAGRALLLMSKIHLQNMEKVLGNRPQPCIFTVRAQAHRTCKWPGGAGTAPGPAQGGKP